LSLITGFLEESWKKWKLNWSKIKVDLIDHLGGSKSFKKKAEVGQRWVLQCRKLMVKDLLSSYCLQLSRDCWVHTWR
jgi:hypothetical protein